MFVVFTGAGISAPSGLPTFADSPEGMKMRQRLSIGFFNRNPEEFYDLYRKLVEMCEQAKPNEAHLAIAQAGVPVITQNIDGLHQRAGSKTVVELHGNLRILSCQSCGRSYPRDDFDYELNIPRCPRCSRILKPAIVLYGEPIMDYEKASEIMGKATYVLVVGTSLLVYPAAYLPELARENGAVIEIINEAAEEKVPEAVARLSRQFGSAGGPPAKENPLP